MNRPAFDWWLFGLALLLSLSGLLYVYSAAWRPPADPELPAGPFFGAMFLKQAAFLAVSLLVFYVVRRINWGLRPATYLWFLGPAAFLLILVLVIGITLHTGSRSWISLGPIEMQPSEFAKLAFVLSLAWLYSDDTGVYWRHYRTALGILLLLLALVLAQPDLGTGMVFVFTFFVMSSLTSIPKRYVVITALSFVLLSIPGWFVLKPYQQNRLISFIWPEADPQGSAYQQKQSMVAIGSGGFTGKGFLRGTQVQRHYVPVVESDFIFALVGEEFGFIGCAYVILLYFLLLARVLALAQHANTAYERYICYGASAVILCHTLIATGMTVRLMPITGLPLPFISYGGSSLLTMWMLIAICEAVYANSQRSLLTPRRRIFTR
jgi:rod shape determining protein RodA